MRKKREVVYTMIFALFFFLPAIVAYIDYYAECKKEAEIEKRVEVRLHVEREKLNALPPEVEVMEIEKSDGILTTAYCSCAKCCGWSTGITYSGAIAKSKHTVAANLNQYPIGTKLIIDGQEYVVEDTGRIPFGVVDIFFDNHEEALNYGVRNSRVVVQ